MHMPLGLDPELLLGCMPELSMCQPIVTKVISTGLQCMQEEALALPPVVPLITVSGRECLLPLHYNGVALNACVNIHGSKQPVCWVKNEGWQVHYHTSCCKLSLDLSSCTIVPG